MTRCATHHDRAGHGLAKPTRRPDNKYVVEGTAGRVHGPGDELVYSWGREKRDARGLATIIGLLPGKPVTLGHGGTRVGIVERARLSADGTHAIATLILDDASALAHATELSLGYGSVLDEHGFQTIAWVSELALVPRGRCGRSCAVQMDHCGCHGIVAAEREARERIAARMTARNFGSTTTAVTPVEPGIPVVVGSLPTTEREALAALNARGGL